MCRTNFLALPCFNVFITLKFLSLFETISKHTYITIMSSMTSDTMFFSWKLTTVTEAGQDDDRFPGAGSSPATFKFFIRFLNKMTMAWLRNTIAIIGISF